MNELDAQSAISCLRNGTKREFAKGPYQSYKKGHDDKHRNKAKAYSHNHNSQSGNEAQGFYQKVVSHIQQPTGQTKTVIQDKFHGWGKPITKEEVQVLVIKQVSVWGDISVDDEIGLLWNAINRQGSIDIETETSFAFTCDIPDGFQGNTFSGGGKMFPKQSKSCSKMKIVVSINPNASIVTHYPL